MNLKVMCICIFVVSIVMLASEQLGVDLSTQFLMLVPDPFEDSFLPNCVALILFSGLIESLPALADAAVS